MASLVGLRNIFYNCKENNCTSCPFAKYGDDCFEKIIDYSYQATNELVERMNWNRQRGK